MPDREEQELGKEAEKEKRETGAVKTFLPGPLQAEVDRLASPLPAPCVAPATLPCSPLCSLPLPPRPRPFPVRPPVAFHTETDGALARCAACAEHARAQACGRAGLCRAGGLEQFCGSEKAKEGYFQSFCDGVMSASVEEELASQVSLAVRAVACDVEPAAQNAQCAKMKHAACSAGTPSPFGSSMPCFTCRVSEGPSAVLGK